MNKSKLFTRAMARMLDYIISFSVGGLISIIFISIWSSSQPINIDPLISKFDEYGVGYYNIWLMLGWFFSIVGLIIVFYIFPLLNKKNKGQTPGKKIFKITPIFETSNVNLAIIMRELPLSFVFILSCLFSMIAGHDFVSFSIQYNSWFNALSSNKDIPNPQTWFEFVLFVSNNSQVMGSLKAEIYQQAFGFLNVLMFTLFSILNLVIWGIILFNPDKKGLHDYIAKTEVINLEQSVMLDKTYRSKHTKIENSNPIKGQLKK